MEIFSLLLLVAVVIVAIKTGSDISYIKGQNMLLHHDIDRLREEIRQITATGTPSVPPMPTDISESEESDDIDEEATEWSDEEASQIPCGEECDVNLQTKDEKKEDTEPMAAASRNNNWEKLIGVNLFSKIGILVLIVGVGFFVKYAIDRDWINEVTRTVLGIGVGLALWGIAYRIRDSYRSFSSILAGGGFAICFTCIAIAFHLYAIFSALTTLLLLVSLTAMMIAISLHFDRLELAIIAIVGAFAAPFIASDGGGSFLFVLAYVAVIDTAMFAVTLSKNWWSLPPLSCFLTYLVCSLGFISGEPGENNAWWLAAIVYYFILFSIPLTSAIFRNSERSRVIFWTVSAIILNGVAYLGFGTFLAGRITTIPHVGGAIGLLGAGINFGIYMKYYLKKNEGLGSNLLVVLIAAFALAAALTFFSNPEIWPATAGVEAAALSWLYIRSGRKIYMCLALVIGVPLTMLLAVYALFESFIFDMAWGYIVTGIAFVGSAYIVLDMEHRESVTLSPLLSTGALWAGSIIAFIGVNGISTHFLPAPAASGLTLLLIGVAMLGILVANSAYNMKSPYALLPLLAILLLGIMGKPAPGTLLVNLPLLGAIVVIALVYYRCAVDVFVNQKARPGRMEAYTVYFNLTVSIFAVIAMLICLDMAGLPKLRSAGISIALTVCAATQMALGMRYHNKLLRLVALCVFGIVIVKLAAYDIWKMVAVGRIIVFILLGVILLAVSFLYQRLRDALLNDNHDENV